MDTNKIITAERARLAPFVERVSGAEVPGPYARNLELMAFPSEKQVANAARRVMYEEEK